MVRVLGGSHWTQGLMSEFAGRDSAPDTFSAEDMLDPCCAKESVNQRKRAAYYRRLRSMDPTRIAVARKQGLVRGDGRGLRGHCRLQVR